MTKELNDAEAALKLIEQLRTGWLSVYTYPNATDYDQDSAVLQLDRIDEYINKYFGKQKWDLIQKDL